METMHTSPHQSTTRHPVLLGLVEAFRLDLIVIPSAFVVATVFWIVGLGAQLDYSIIPEWAFALWAVVHGLSVSTIGFDFSLAPGLVTLGVWLLLAAGASRLVSTLSDADPIRSDDGEETPWWAMCAMALAGFALAYAGPLVALSLIVGEATMTPLGFLRLLVLLVTAFVVGYVRARGVVDIPWFADLDPALWQTAVAVARRVLWGAASLAVVVIGAALVLRWSDLAEAMGTYSSPLSAGIGLTVLQLLFAPGALFGALSWIAGTGVSIGAGGVSSVFSTVSGPVPPVPVLELLVGDYPVWTRAAPALLVLLGVGSVVIGRTHARAVHAASWTGLAIAGGILFVIAETIALFSRGAIGPLGLAAFGPSPLTSALAVCGWIGVGLSLGLVLTKLSHMQFDDAVETADHEEP
jgi:hypothetical protein